MSFRIFDPERSNEPQPQHPNRRQGTQPPGGILAVAVLSALSGAIMGLLLGGHFTAALAAFLALPLGVVIGFWIRGLPD